MFQNSKKKTFTFQSNAKRDDERPSGEKWLCVDTVYLKMHVRYS